MSSCEPCSLISKLKKQQQKNPPYLVVFTVKDLKLFLDAAVMYIAIKVGSLPECSSFSPYTPYTTPSGKWITTTALNYLCSST